MKHNNLGLLISGCTLMMVGSVATAQGTLPAQPSAWQLSAHVAEESVGQGLPVLALDGKEWPNYLPASQGNTRAFRSIKAELQATHPSGWRIATLARAEAWLQANADAVTLAALEAKGSDPAAANRYAPQASGQSWTGQGVKLGTPWQPVGATGLWQWQADAELLQLRRLRKDEISGSLNYQGGGVYDFDLQSQRSNTNITSPFLGASGPTGVGASLSIALRGLLAPGWRAELRADDLLSQLQWTHLATDSSKLNSQVTSHNPDGTLDYAPLLTGKKMLANIESEIGTRWQALVFWSAFEQSQKPDQLTLQVTSKAGIHQSWFGWDNGETSPSKPHLRAALEPRWRAVKLEMAWAGWQVVVATDGKGLATQYRNLSLTWRTAF